MFKFVLFYRDRYLRALNNITACSISRKLNDESTAELTLKFDKDFLTYDLPFNYRVGVICDKELFFVGMIVNRTIVWSEKSISLVCKDLLYYLKRRVYLEKRDFVDTEQAQILKSLIESANAPWKGWYTPQLGTKRIVDTGVKLDRRYSTAQNRSRYPMVFTLIAQLAEKKTGFLFYNDYALSNNGESPREDFIVIYPFRGRDSGIKLRDGINCSISELEIDSSKLNNHVYLESSFSSKEDDKQRYISTVLQNERQKSIFPKLDARKGFEDIGTVHTLKDRGYPLLERGRNPLFFPELELNLKTREQVLIGDAVQLFHRDLRIDETRFLVTEINHNLDDNTKDVTLINLNAEEEDD
jgi:hypothetical protein